MPGIVLIFLKATSNSQNLKINERSRLRTRDCDESIELSAEDQYQSKKRRGFFNVGHFYSKIIQMMTGSWSKSHVAKTEGKW